MKPGDLVYYFEQRMVEVQFLGLVISGPDHSPTGNQSYKVWWIGQHDAAGSAKIGRWDEHRLRVLSEG
jgi:hypothetical protein